MRRPRLAAAILLALLSPPAALALAPEEIVLLANKRVPQSEQLARFYAQQRGIPDGRLVLLDLPITETMPGEKFDDSVVLPLRRELEARQLRDKARCLVTFYGVPLRLAPRNNTPAEIEELRTLHSRLAQALPELKRVVEQLESALAAASGEPATALANAPTPPAGAAAALPALRERAAAALNRGSSLLPALDLDKRLALMRQLRDAITNLGGELALAQLPEAYDAIAPAPAMLESRQERPKRLQEAAQQAMALRLKRGDAASRAQLRQWLRDQAGLLEVTETLSLQSDYLEPGPTKALDNELSLLWYDQYPRANFLPNPLHFGARAPGASRPPAIMVARLDAPEPGLVRDIILASVLTERKGLSGRFAIDSRGLSLEGAEPKEVAYARADESLRQLSHLLTTRTKLPVIHDDTPDLFRPGAASDVALYVGWYKVRSYTPSLKFLPGAIAYHIASYEMISLRNNGEKGWCRGLLLDGVAATIGPVDEPYLIAFPDASDFFPLLLTGRHTLAEAYWLTLPLVNWKMVLIGDPLYAPFAKSPALKRDDLPARLWDADQATP
jgi:uncharacterized protein (TIGR03790 family)